MSISKLNLCLFAASVVVAMLIVGQMVLPSAELQQLPSNGTRLPMSSRAFYPIAIGPQTTEPLPRITHVQIVNGSGLTSDQPTVLVCDARANAIFSYHAEASGAWHETRLAENIEVPAHATVVDLDHDGDQDLLVAGLGSMYPDDTLIGRVYWLENQSGMFVKRIVIDQLRRVADVQAGDLDQDGDLDLAVAVFGYARGEVLWLENDGNQNFSAHQLINAAGAIHVPLGDFNGDGKLDIATVISQEDEQVIVWENQGDGQFRSHVVFESFNYDLGSAGLVVDDLDQDGRVDLLLPVGDNLEYTHAYPQPYHGCLWLKNLGDWSFSNQSIAQFGGTYAAAVGDFDGDRDRDVALVSMSNDWSNPQHPSLIWLENDGDQNFAAAAIDTEPIHLITVASGDLDGDGIDDLVAGGMNLMRPHERIGRVVGWTTRPQ